MFDRIYGIYDLKSEYVTGPLLLLPADASACRMFSDVIRAPGSQVHEHPADFNLVCFGSFDRDEHGVLRLIAPAPGSAMYVLLTGADVVRSMNAPGVPAVSEDVSLFPDVVGV